MLSPESIIKYQQPMSNQSLMNDSEELTMWLDCEAGDRDLFELLLDDQYPSGCPSEMDGDGSSGGTATPALVELSPENEATAPVLSQIPHFAGDV